MKKLVIIIFLMTVSFEIFSIGRRGPVRGGPVGALNNFPREAEASSPQAQQGISEQKLLGFCELPVAWAIDRICETNQFKSCPICLEDFTQAQGIKIFMSCSTCMNGIFCLKEELLQWKANSLTKCPICQAFLSYVLSIDYKKKEMKKIKIPY